MEGNDIISEVETLSGFHGPEIANLILRDRVDIGFSLRALGGVNERPDGTIEVLSPIKPITYDIVSNPSHVSAKIMKYLPESAISGEGMNDDLEYIMESEDLQFLANDNIYIKNNSIIESSYLDDIISENFDNGIKQIKFFKQNKYFGK